MTATDRSVTSLVNRSLRLLGERPIQTIANPETPAGRILVDAYDDCRREVQRRCPCTFAEMWTFWEYAGPTPTVPGAVPTTGGTFSANQMPFDYADTYTIPDNYIRLIDIPGLTPQSGLSFQHNSITDFRFINAGPPDFQRLIALDNNASETLPVCMIVDVPLLSRWDPLTRKVLSTWLALDQAIAITGKQAIAQGLVEMLKCDLQDAIGVSGNEQPKHESRFSRVARDRELSFLGGTSWFTSVSGYPNE